MACQNGFVPVTDEDDEREAVSQLVRAGRWTRCIGPGELVEHPVRWRTETLLVLLPISSMLAPTTNEINSSFKLVEVRSLSERFYHSVLRGCISRRQQGVARLHLSMTCGQEWRASITYGPRGIFAVGFEEI